MATVMLLNVIYRPINILRV